MSEDDKRREKRCLLSVHPDVSGLVQLAVTKEVFAKCVSRCQLAVTKEKRGVC